VSEPRVHWQPISALPMIASMIDGLLDEVEKQHENIQVLPPETARARQLHGPSRDGCLHRAGGRCRAYQEQLSRWTKLVLDSGQRQEVDRLAQQIPRIPCADRSMWS
jgi:hypothetical protein